MSEAALPKGWKRIRAGQVLGLCRLALAVNLFAGRR